METEVRRWLAEAELMAGHPERSIQLLNGRVENRPTLAVVLARAQHKIGDRAGAIATLTPFVSKLPNDNKGIPDPRVPAAVATEYGQLLGESGRASEGIARLEQATRIEPNRRDAWVALSAALSKAGRKEESLRAQARAEALAAARPANPTQ
jgi:tetratricopeptide (TPR) repeat protein